MHRVLLACGLIVALLLIGCAPPVPPPTPTADPAAPLTIAAADQVDAPALAALGERVLIFWIDADRVGVQHAARWWTPADGLSAPVVLPLPPRHPFAQTAYPGLGGVHLLWIDADPAAPEINRLYGAFITGGLRVERGPTPLTPDGVRVSAYAALSRPDGSLWIAWTDERDQLALTIADADGRPLPPQQLASNAAAIAITAGADLPDEAAHLFWESRRDGRWQTARLTAEGSTPPRPLTSTVYRAPGDRVLHTAAALYSGQTVLVQTVQRTDGAITTWTIGGDLTAPNWDAPRPLVDSTGQPIALATFADSAAVPALIGSTPDGIARWRWSPDGWQLSAVIAPGVRVIRPPRLVDSTAAWSAITADGVQQVMLTVPD